MKKFVLFPLCISALALSGCLPSKQSKSSEEATSASISPSDDEDVYVPEEESHEWGNDNITGEFSLMNSSSEASGFSVSNSVYTISTGDTYTLSGKLSGRIVIEAGSSDTVELDLSNVSISSSDNSPIFVKSADKVKIKSMAGTSNFIYDKRSTKTVDVDDQGEGAIAAKADLNFIGKGELNVEGNYNNGIHTSKDLKIKNTQLKVVAYQHALRGGNSISITESSTYIYTVSKNGDGLKSNDAGLTSKGKQKGSITISGGKLYIYAKNDGIDAAYDAIIQTGTGEDDGLETVPAINIYTDKYSPTSFKSIVRAGPGGGGGGPGWNDESNTDKSDTTAKGIKAANEVKISGGSIYMETYDDGLHANNEALTDGDDQETGYYGKGNISISGGNITIKASDDGMHADNVLNISGGIVNVLTSYEGLEGHEIVIDGGKTYAYGTDDGMNAGGNENPSITVNGGYLEIEVSMTGDTDGIDSNGTYTQNGGIVIAKGPANGGASALDSDGSFTLNAGTIIVLGSIEQQGGGGWGGKSNFTVSSSMNSYSLSLHSSGEHSVLISGETYTFTNKFSHSKTICYSDVSVSGS